MNKYIRNGLGPVLLALALLSMTLSTGCLVRAHPVYHRDWR